MQCITMHTLMRAGEVSASCVWPCLGSWLRRLARHCLKALGLRGDIVGVWEGTAAVRATRCARRAVATFPP